MKTVFIYLFILFSYGLIFSQSDKTFFIRGNLNVNNNGIDWVPLFQEISPHLLQISLFGERDSQ